MFFLLGGQDKKARKTEKKGRLSGAAGHVREVFLAGRFPVVTTHQVEGRCIAKVLGWSAAGVSILRRPFRHGRQGHEQRRASHCGL